MLIAQKVGGNKVQLVLFFKEVIMDATPLISSKATK